MIEELNDNYNDIFSDVKYEAALPAVKKDFLPWHKPRKQYIRHYQWIRFIHRISKEIKESGKSLNYLGLPGIDLLDLRYIHSQICEKEDLELCFVGFNSSAARPDSDASVELNISLDEVRRLPLVSEFSEVVTDDFCSISNRSSMAHKKVCAIGPYDVVNLDLCDGIAKKSPKALTNNYYDAINQLFSIQAKSKLPWLLFLTTRTDKDNVDSEVLEKLILRYVEKLDSCKSFRDASTEHFDIANEESLLAAVEDPLGLLSVFLTGICKWFLSLGGSIQPPFKMELCDVAGYTIDSSSKCSDLFSIAIKFTPTFMHITDLFGFSQPEESPIDECIISTRALKRIHARKDVDELLSQNTSLKSELIDQSATLLNLARYDVSEYRSWVDKV